MYDVQQAIESVFDATKDTIQAGDDPVVLLNHFGSFRMLPRNVDYYIKVLIRKTRAEYSEGITNGPNKQKLQQYWALRQKMKKYKHVS
ncbi:hypothetical protein KC678_05855 [Candidatus Dojkabacteria bacterium]|uniref:Uncharacterized protein n=1 Tax=Candidatus Dojkabacteria bacterium TaxID=2099670 RepID=A0A955RHW8_9BACT|nr:hypothetical protein [Candidatus Dojkabacteria bacterium]